jgi:rhamnogalacturonan endolyase
MSAKVTNKKYVASSAILCMMPFLLGAIFFCHTSFGQYQMEKLNRGVVAVRTGSNNFISWRFLGNEDDAVTFNLYRGTTKVNATPLNVTNYSDNGAAANSTYYVRAIVNGTEQPQSETVSVWGQQYLSVPLQIPAGGTTPSGETYTYSASDCSIGDVDGDGAYEIFVKWEPSNAKDNSQSGYTGNVYIDCYKINGTRLWRIDLGRNIRAGAHYTQYMVYDFDGDGKAEMACKTADATRDGANTVIGNANADYRSTAGYVLTGPEYLTMFNGQTGRIMQTIDYVPARGTVGSWGDTYGNRVDRFLAGVAYLDGKKPSLISCRGYYTRTVLVAWDWVNGAFVRRWTFDSNVAGSQYAGMGDHSLSIGDVDSDGKQEIIYGSMVIDDNGTVLYATGNGHGDALHVSDFDPNNPGLEIFNIQERDDTEDCYLYSAQQKRIIWSKGATGGEGPGRGVGANISDNSAGAEFWVAGGQGLTGAPWSPTGASSGLAGPASCNFLIWWDGDLARELQNGTVIDKHGTGRLLTTSGVSSNNGTKATPNLSGDILGDWREELILRTSDNTSLRIYTTVNTTTHKIRTLVHDAQYRVALAWQNTAYNQPPHPSFFLGNGVALPTKPNITIIGGSAINVGPTVSITAPANNATYTSPASITINANAADVDGLVSKVDFYNGTTLIGTDNTSTYSFNWTNVAVGTYTITARATDDDGAVTISSAITITVTSPNTAPTVSITSPVNNTIVSGTPATITINATAADANGTVSKVDFYNGTTLLGTDNSMDYSFNWTGVAAGTYTLTAVATDNGGATTTSTPVVISVVDQPGDCNGVSGGSATTDACGRCVGGNTGKTACATLAEAEATACEFEGILEATNEGFNGDGYINVPNAVGASMTYVITAANAGAATLSFRYANGTTVDRPAQITVNNTSMPGTVSFPGTGTWMDWSIVDASVQLAQGNNVIVVASVNATGLANIDQIGLVSSGLSFGNCGVVTGAETTSVSAGMRLYPNPSNSDFTLQLPENASVIKVLDVQGATLENTVNKQFYQFGQGYASGVYFVHITTNGTTQVLRVVKK